MFVYLLIFACTIDYSSSDRVSYTQSLVNTWAGSSTTSAFAAVALVSSGSDGNFTTSFVSSKLPPQFQNLSTDISDILFEIGSTTKVFTAVAAQMLVDAGFISSMDDPIEDYLPTQVKMEPGVAAITLRQLASHTSGLARMPSNFRPSNPLNPYADYTVSDLYVYLSTLSDAQLGPKVFLYSNTGFGLLGLIVALVWDTSYEEAVKDLVIDPLGLLDTTITLTPQQKQRLIPGTSQGKVIPNWDFTDALAGAGALRSSANDLSQFLAANLGLRDTPANISTALYQARQMIASDGSGPMYGSVGEAYQQYWSRLLPVTWKDGATGGYNCFSAFDETNKLGITFLSNVNYADGIVAQPAMTALSGPPPAYSLISVSSTQLARCVGTFNVSSTFGFTSKISTTAASTLIIQGTGQGAYPYFAFGPTITSFASETPAIYAEFRYISQIPGQSHILSSDKGVLTDNFNVVSLHQFGRDLFCLRQTGQPFHQLYAPVVRSNQRHFYDLDTRCQEDILLNI